MDTVYWKPGQGGETSIDTGDWRSHLEADSRRRIVDKLMEILKSHLSIPGPELKEVAVRFEEKIFTAATSQSDYLRKMSLKMLTMETKSKNPMPISLQSNSASGVQNPPDPASQSMQSQQNIQGTPLPISVSTNQFQAGQQQDVHQLQQQPFLTPHQYLHQQQLQHQMILQAQIAMPEASSSVINRPIQGGELSRNDSDWRSQLQADSRQRIVNKIKDTLNRCLPFSGQEGLRELNKIAVRFEEKIYTAATSQSDYLRKISLKMLTMERTSESSTANSLSNLSNTGLNLPDPVLTRNQLVADLQCKLVKWIDNLGCEK